MPRRAVTTANEVPPMPPITTHALEASWLDIDSIIASPLNPRKPHAGDDTDLDGLEASIRQHGVLQPIVVRVSLFEPGKYELVAGSRRHAATKRAGLETIPATVRAVTDAQLLELALTENIQRKNMHPLDEAKALDRLRTLDRIYADDKVLAGKIGRSETYVRDRLKLLKLEPVVLEALDVDAITAKHAERIARLPKDQHIAALAACFGALYNARKSIEKQIDDKEWAELALDLVKLSQFDEWVEDHTKVDIDDPAVRKQLKLEPVAEQRTEADDQADIDAAAVVRLQLSDDGYLDRDTARAMNVIPSTAWKEVKSEKNRCEYTRAAVVVHGGKLRTLDACTRRSCSKHFPKPRATSSGRSAPANDYKAEQEKCEKRAAEWKRVRGRYFAALAEHVELKFTKLTAAIVRNAVAQWERNFIAKEYGVALTDKTALTVLVLSLPRTSELQFFGPDAKKLGLNVDAVTKAIAAEDAAAAKAAAKTDTQAKTPAPAKKKGKAKK